MGLKTFGPGKGFVTNWTSVQFFLNCPVRANFIKAAGSDVMAGTEVTI